MFVFLFVLAVYIGIAMVIGEGGDCMIPGVFFFFSLFFFPSQRRRSGRFFSSRSILGDPERGGKKARECKETNCVNMFVIFSFRYLPGEGEEKGRSTIVSRHLELGAVNKPKTQKNSYRRISLV